MNKNQKLIDAIGEKSLEILLKVVRVLKDRAGPGQIPTIEGPEQKGIQALVSILRGCASNQSAQAEADMASVWENLSKDELNTLLKNSDKLCAYFDDKLMHEERVDRIRKALQ